MASVSRWALVVIYLSMFSVLAGCGHMDKSYAYRVLKDRNADLSSVYYDQKLTDWLPNQAFKVDGRRATQLGTGIVVGKIITVQPGQAYADAGVGADKGVEVPYSSEKALWKTVVITVAPDNSLGQFDDPKKVRLGLSINGDDNYEAFADSLMAQESVIVVVGKQGRYRHDKSLYSIGRNGQLLGTVSPSGTISFPAMESADAASYTTGAQTVREVTIKASQTRPPIVIEDGVRR